MKINIESMDLFKFVKLSFVNEDHEQKQILNTVLLKEIYKDSLEMIPLGLFLKKTQYGYTAKADKVSGSYGYVRITDINSGSIDWSKVPYCECDRLNYYEIKKGDILIARTGGTIGKNILINNVEKTSVFASYLIRLSPSFDNCIPEYIYSFLNSYLFWNQILSMRNGVAQPNVNAEKMKKLLIPKLSLDKQKEIFIAKNSDISKRSIDISKKLLDRFSTSQSLQAEQSKQLKLLDDLNQAILQEAVQGKLVPQDPQEGMAKDLLAEIQKAKSASAQGKKSKPLPPITGAEIPFSIPKNWVWVRLGEVCEIFGGGTPSMGKREYWNGDIPWVSPKDMKTDYITDTKMKITSKGIENSAAKLIRENSILVVGRSGILKRTFPVAINKCECTVNQDMKVLIPLSILSPFYLFYLLKGLEYVILARFVKYGMTVHSLKYSEFESMCVPLPPLAEQKRIVSAIERERAKIAELKREVESRQVAVENLRKAILQEAFG